MKQAQLDYILEAMLDSHDNVSDLNFTVGKPLQVESSGELVEVSIKPPIHVLTPYHTETIAMHIIGRDRRLLKSLIETGSADASYYIGDRARFRVNIFSQQNRFSLVLRKLETEIPTLEKMGLPPILKKISEEKNGLVVVTGATGSGKSTTLAAVLDIINQSKSVHVVTLEDPVEYLHPHKRATFNQRELGKDFDSFANGLRAALRQAPKVILVGEMRDRETMEIGLTAAETGHLVVSTLHTVDAGQTMSRIVGMFELEEEKLIRTRLADSMRWVVSQRLIPKIGGGRTAALEIMGSSLRTKEAIQHGEQEGKPTFYDIISDAYTYGWKTFDHSLLEAYQKKQISEETAIAYASRKPIVQRGIDQIKAAKGEKTTDIDELSLDTKYDKSMTVFRKK